MTFSGDGGLHEVVKASDVSTARPRTAQRRWRWVAALGVVAACLIAVQPAFAVRITERTKHKRAVEAERAKLQERLNALKRDITRTETARSHAADALANSEKAISEANRALHELANEHKSTEARLARLTDQQNRLEKAVASQQAKLAKLLREQYMAGNEDRIKLLLSGDNPNRINRDLQYMGYVSQAQAKLIAALRKDLQAIETGKEEAQNARDELDEIAAEQVDQKAKLEKELSRRAELLARLSDKLAAQRKEAGNLERDEQRLAGLVKKLSDLIEEQRKSDAAAMEQRREQQQALAKARESRNDATSAAGIQDKSKNRAANPDAIDDDEPPAEISRRNELAPVASVQNAGLGPAGQAFASLRGQLKLPVKGELAARYGSKRGDGPSWKGLFIRAAEGTDIRAIATGKVVFAEWLRGFGNLIIVDHGDQYLSIYGNNQAVLKQAGDIVKTGDVIASAGNSGGNEQSGLYFELRHQGRAFDPLGWISASFSK
jgi:septal ring factor EnvC (AmiA/AmiB activator)